MTATFSQTIKFILSFLAENEKQKLKLADELRRRREARLNKQQEQHEAEKEMFLGSLDKETNTSNFVEVSSV